MKQKESSEQSHLESRNRECFEFYFAITLINQQIVLQSNTNLLPINYSALTKRSWNSTNFILSITEQNDLQHTAAMTQALRWMPQQQWAVDKELDGSCLNTLNYIPWLRISNQGQWNNSWHTHRFWLGEWLWCMGKYWVNVGDWNCLLVLWNKKPYWFQLR